jgi:rubrerythrin
LLDAPGVAPLRDGRPMLRRLHAEPRSRVGAIQEREQMQKTSRLLALLALGAAVTFAACAGSPDASPVASSPTGTGDTAAFTSSGYGPGAPASTPGTGTCTNDCDGTGQGPGPGAGPHHGDGSGPGPADGYCGAACTGPVGPDPADIAEVLGAAIQEEYGAENLYRSVLEDYDGAMPFATIVEAEAQHVLALQRLFTRREMAVPSRPPVPDTSYASLALACAAGVDAEEADAAFYTPYLERTDLPQDVRNVFTNLQAASLENHLPAFQACAN